MTETVIDNRSILREWATAFPELGKYGTKYLLRVCGPVALGIELFKTFPTTYRPEAVLMNLADITYPRPVAVIHQCLREKNRVQLDIRYDRHWAAFKPATEAMREQAPTVVAPLPSLVDIIQWILRFMHEDQVQGTNVFQECKAIMMLSKLLRDDQKGVQYFAAAVETVRQMPDRVLEAETQGFDRWLGQLRDTAPRQLLDNVHQNIERWKMGRLPSCGSLPDLVAL